MAVRQPRYSKEDFAQRGDLIYQTQIRPQVELGNHGKIVAIDIETGDFEVANSPILAVDRLYERKPDAQPWVIRIGHKSRLPFWQSQPEKARMMFGVVNNNCEAIIKVAVKSDL